MSGRQRPIACIQPGSTDERHVDAAEEQHQEVGEIRDEEEVAVAYSPIDPSSIPKAVHEHAVTTSDERERGHASPAGGRKPRKTTPTRKPNAETMRPFASTGTPRPRNIASRFAGEASSGPSVPN